MGELMDVIMDWIIDWIMDWILDVIMDYQTTLDIFDQLISWATFGHTLELTQAFEFWWTYVSRETEEIFFL